LRDEFDRVREVTNGQAELALLKISATSIVEIGATVGAELDGARRIGDRPLIVSLKIERCEAGVKRDRVRGVKLNGARRIGEGAVIVPFV
jgi:hypothetical protein